MGESLDAAAIFLLVLALLAPSPAAIVMRKELSGECSQDTIEK